jgi:indole-3-glycerol phosphate synthase
VLAGQADLLAVCERVQIPVLQLDWMLHPIQLIDSAEAGVCAPHGPVTVAHIHW